MAHDPEGLFQAAMDAINAEDWDTLARLCDPASLRLFRASVLRSHGDRPRRVMTAEDFRRYSPDMRLEVAEYNAGVSSASQEGRLQEEFPTVRSVDELAMLSPEETFAAWLRGRSPRQQIEQSVRQGLTSRAAADRALSQPQQQIPSVVLGVVYDSKRVAHVVYRSDYTPTPDPAVTDAEERAFQLETMARRMAQVLTCTRLSRSGNWQLIADYNLLGLGYTMHVAIEADE